MIPILLEESTHMSLCTILNNILHVQHMGTKALVGIL